MSWVWITLNYIWIPHINKLCRMLVFSQGNKGLVGHNNPLGLGSLGSKSPLQSPPNVSVSKDLMGGMHPQLMPNTSHPNQLHSTMPMSSIQGEFKKVFVSKFLNIGWLKKSLFK